MSGSYLDSTIVIHICDTKSTSKKPSETCIANHQPAEAPFYALREVLVGRLQYLILAHNNLLAAENSGEAILSILRTYYMAGRKKDSAVHAIASSIRDTYNPSAPQSQMKQEVLDDLAIQINTLWLDAQNIPNVNLVQPLACFIGGKITHGSANELRAPSDSFNCLTTERCAAAAAYLYDDKLSLEKMVEALHPNKLPLEIKNKGETAKRRAAMRELLLNGPKSFSKKKCRALGDGYFAGMCPAGKAVMTTNLDDFTPLCNALGKPIISP